MTTVLTSGPPTGRVADDAAGAELTLATKLVAVAACVAVGMRIDLFKGVTPGLVVMVVLAPVWWPQLRTSWVVRVLTGLTALAVVVGFVMAWTVREQRGVDWRIAYSTASLVTLTFAGLVVLLWARTLISVSAAVASMMAGVVLFELSAPGLWADDPWKFGFARPVTVLVLLAVAWSARRAGRAQPWLAATALLVLAVVGAVFDYRSESGFLVLVVVLVLWQAIAVGHRRRLRALSPALLLVTVAGAVYLGATQLFVSGALGTAIQERSTEQIDASGSLLLGGRPEWSATVELMGARPQGYGFGVLADSVDVGLAQNGFMSINVDPDTGYLVYISNYMLTDGFHLHSVAADLWSVTGPVGLVLAGFVAVLTIWSLSASLAVGRAEPLLLYTTIVVVWDIAFSPLQSAATEIVLGLFVAVVSLEHLRTVRTAAVGVTDPADPPGASPADPPGAARSGAGPAPVIYGAAAAAPERNGGRRGPV